MKKTVVIYSDGSPAYDDEPAYLYPECVCCGKHIDLSDDVYTETDEGFICEQCGG